MAQISYAGAFNSATLNVPDVYLNILQPKGSVIRPASIGVLAIVGLASWGPVNVATQIGSPAQLALFGSQTNRKYDLFTAASIALQIQAASGGGAGLMLTRVTDGTDLAASVVIGTTQITITSLYTGTAANSATFTIAAGTLANSWKAVVVMPGFPAETFDNITGAGNALWVAMANAINNGNSQQRGPSQLVTATAGAAATSPVAATSNLAGGVDGTTTITSAVLLGVDGAARTGIYTFRGQGCSHGHVADLDDHLQNATLATFAQSEGIYWGAQNTIGQTPSAAVTQKNTDGTDNPWLKLFLGDWVYANDNVNGVQRLLGPATFGMAALSCLQPQQSGLNKQVPLVVATQRSKSGTPYANTDFATLTGSSIEVITNPIPRGSMFGLRIGRSSSSDATRNSDNWPVLTSFLARSLAGPGALGPAIGEVITPDFFTTWYAVLDNWLAGLKNAAPQPVIQDYQIKFDATNNPPSQTAQGLVVAEVLIQYQGIAMVFLVNLQTGATVVIPPASSPSFARAA